MLHISDEHFEQIIANAIDSLPERFLEHAKNVAIVWADEPNPLQREKLRLRGGDLLFGLYEGIPMTSRGDNYNLVLPDKITIFKQPTLRVCHTEADVARHVKHTLWHEIAHHYGLDHDRIHELENES